MDQYSTYIMQELKKRKMQIKELSELSKLDYMQLYNSLQNKSRKRPLRASEYITICKVLQLDPFGAQKTARSRVSISSIAQKNC